MANDTPAARHIADLRGERCPYTFIKARLAIEELPLGEVLEVILDFRPAWERVPGSMAIVGHELVRWREGPAEARTFEFRRGKDEPD